MNTSTLLSRVASLMDNVTNMVKQAVSEERRKELRSKVPPKYSDLKLKRHGPDSWKTDEGYSVMVSSDYGNHGYDRSGKYVVFAPEDFKDFNGLRKTIHQVDTLDKAKYWIVRHMKGLEG